MGRKTFIITGSGRSGTFKIHEFLKQYTDFTVHHEANFEQMLKLGVLSYEGMKIDGANAREVSAYYEMLRQSRKTSVDVSNAAVWCVEPLSNFDRGSNFFMVVRNGYKVVSSFYYKFRDLMYPTDMIEVARSAYQSKKFDHALDKRFWRPLPQNPEFFERYESDIRFAVICWYWAETLTQYEKYKSLYSGMFRFEDIVSGASLKDFAETFGIAETGDVYRFFERPTNIESRTNHKLSAVQNSIFEDICGTFMRKYYSDLEYYDVEY